MRRTPSREAIQAWNLNQERGFQAAWEALREQLEIPDYTLRRALVAMDGMLSAADREELRMWATDRTLESTDNWVNRGDEQGGRLWTYVEPPVEPPGRDGESLWGELARKPGGKRGRMLRHYCFPQGLDDPLALTNRAKSSLHYRLMDVQRLAGRLLGKRGVVESLDELFADGREPDATLWTVSDFEAGDVMDADAPTPGRALRKSRVLALAREADATLHSVLARCQRGSFGREFHVQTRRFLRYVLWLAQSEDGYLAYEAWCRRLGSRAEEQPLEELFSGFRIARWRQLAAPGWVEAGLISPAEDGSAERSLHEQWHSLCKALAPSRTALDKTKNRSERAGSLDAFYLVIGHCPSYRRGSGPGSPCERVRKRYPELFEGDIGPDDASFCRQHLEECSRCFWAFRDYVDDRIRWGCRPQPLVAALRERLAALGAGGLKARIGELGSDAADLLRGLAEGGQGQAASRAALASASGLHFTGRVARRSDDEPGQTLERGRAAVMELLQAARSQISEAAAQLERSGRLGTAGWTQFARLANLEAEAESLEKEATQLEALDRRLRELLETLGEYQGAVSHQRTVLGRRREERRGTFAPGAEIGLLFSRVGAAFSAHRLDASGDVTTVVQGYLHSRKVNPTRRSVTVQVAVGTGGPGDVLVARLRVGDGRGSVATELGEGGVGTLVLGELPEHLEEVWVEEWLLVGQEPLAGH